MATLDPPRDDLDAALNEATVVGLRARGAGSVALLLHVLALPEEGPADPDTRRALVLSGVSRNRVLLRRIRPHSTGPPIPLRDLDAVEEFFASTSRVDSMYGWEFLDHPAPVDDWPSVVSLDLSSGRGTHSLYWFAECGVPAGGGENAWYLIQGVIEFEDLSVERFDGTPVPVEDFVAAGKRWWQALFAGDPRTSGEAQQALAEPKWRLP